MNSSRTKELESRCRLIAERITDSVRIVDHDPSLALYRLQEHVGRSLPGIIERKIQQQQQSTQQAGVLFDLDNAKSTVDNMKNASSSFENCIRMLHTCTIYMDFSGSRKSSDSGVKARSKSLHNVARDS